MTNYAIWEDIHGRYEAAELHFQTLLGNAALPTDNPRVWANAFAAGVRLLPTLFSSHSFRLYS